MDRDIIAVGFLALVLILGLAHTWWWAKREGRKLDEEAEAYRARRAERSGL